MLIAAVSRSVRDGIAATPRWSALLAIAIAARLATFGNPIVHVDEEFYYSVAHAMARGAMPYVDIWDRKPLGLFLIYLPAGYFGLPVGIWVYQALALFSVVVTALLVARFAEEAGWPRAALTAAALYILCLDLADGQGGQAAVFFNLTMTGAALITLRSGRQRAAARRRLGIGAIALVGVSLQIKYSAIFEGVAFGLYLLCDDWRECRSVRSLTGYGASLIAVAVLPTATAALAYAGAGHFSEFWYANFVSIFARRPDPAGTAQDALLTASVLLSPLLLLAVVGSGSRQSDAGHRRSTAFLRLWLAAAISGFLVFGSWFNHYTLPIMPPAASGAAAFVGGRRSGRAIAIALCAMLFVAGQEILWRERANRGTPAQFAALADSVGRGRGSLYVYQGPTLLHLATGRPSLTRYLFPTHLMFQREQGAVGIDQGREIARIFDRHPEIVVMQSAEAGEDLSKRAIAQHRLMTDGYRRYALLRLGNKRVAVFRRSQPRHQASAGTRGLLATSALSPQGTRLDP